MATDTNTALREAERCLARGDAPSAEALLREQPNDAEAVNMLGNALAAQRRWDEAEACYRRAMALAPRLYKPLANLGNLLSQRGLRAEAIKLYYEALALEPSAFRTRTNLGHDMLDLGHVAEAIAAYTGALAQRPDHVPARLGLGRALLAEGRAAEALAEIDRALAVAPDRADLHQARGLCLERLGVLDEAAAAQRRAIALDPNRPIAHKNLAIVLSALGKLDDAAAAAERALALDPGLAAAHLALGTIRARQSRFDDAIDCYRRALDGDPSLSEALSNIGGALQQKGRTPEALAHLRRALELSPRHAVVRSNLLMALHYDLAAGPRALAEEHRAFGRVHGTLPGITAPRARPKAKLRIGYLSADLRDHSVARFIEPILAAHDPASFDVVVYASVARPDRITERLRALVPTWRDVRGLSDVDLADLVRRDAIDILVELGGHSADSRLLVLAHRPAPVQVTYLGYPNTTGLSAVNYRLTDAVADPPGLADELCVEQLVRLPDCAWCYVAGDAPEPSPPPEIEAGAVTFGCFNDFSKARPDMMALWADILARVAGSRLVLKAKSLADPALECEVRAFFAERGIDGARLVVRGWARDRAEHLAQHAAVDIALDTFPYHGTTTTCDALWMGVPVITLVGESHVSRVGLSLLTAVGLADLATRSPDEYLAVAVQLATDRARRLDLRRTLRDRFQASPLGSASQFTRALESAYRTMWRERISASTAPEEIAIPEGSEILPLPAGARIVVPARRDKITPSVLYEQGDWFEDEIRFVRRLLPPGSTALDVGANYGVYAISMAHAVGASGLVVAFEPAPETVQYLDASVALDDRLQLDVIEAAVSNRSGDATFFASPDAELSSLHASGPVAEETPVDLVTIDESASSWAGRSVAFIKLDAEGEERAILEGARATLSAHEPLVMYEIKQGATVDRDLPNAFAARGLRSYRLVPGLGLLAPFDAALALDPFQLNLFACTDTRAADLAARGLLARGPGRIPRDLDPSLFFALARQRLYALPFVDRFSDLPASPLLEALSAWAFAHEAADVAPEDRLAALTHARDRCLAHVSANGSVAASLTLARLFAELGERRRAVEVLIALEPEVAAGARPTEPFLPATPRFDSISPRGDLGRYALACVLAARERLSRFSSVYGVHDPSVYRRFLDLGFRDEEMARRLELVIHRRLLGIAPEGS
ncbi:TPR domain protein [Minicystis rosea]|nr:TPR domain protein [Minicystis rosea]